MTWDRDANVLDCYCTSECLRGPGVHLALLFMAGLALINFPKIGSFDI